ncbi:MAG: hypothetical protein V7K48_12170 [Nostoc sp.]|uniref:hypothetical protein n=1 Tax=Nostoc sp. TaxID=1180 RepID=UPI002FFC9655
MLHDIRLDNTLAVRRSDVYDERSCGIFEDCQLLGRTYAHSTILLYETLRVGVSLSKSWQFDKLSFLAIFA